jgi:site-specific recombinase XerD
MSASTLVGPLLQCFLVDYLRAQKRLSDQTVASYRDTFRLLLRSIHHETGIGPAALTISYLDAPCILRFLEGIEKERKNAVVSRNLRLTAIRSFFRLVAFRDPASAGVATRVLAIPMKRADRKVRDYATSQEVEAILAVFDQKQWLGRRNYALLLTMYNTGARVSEIIALRQNQFSLGSKGQVQLCGKGRKEQLVPLWSRTAIVFEILVRRTQTEQHHVRLSESTGRTLDAVRSSSPFAEISERSIRSLPESEEKTDISSSPSTWHGDGLVGISCNDFSLNGKYPLNLLSHITGSLQGVVPSLDTIPPCNRE